MCWNKKKRRGARPTMDQGVFHKGGEEGKWTDKKKKKKKKFAPHGQTGGGGKRRERQIEPNPSTRVLEKASLEGEKMVTCLVEKEKKTVTVLYL